MSRRRRRLRPEAVHEIHEAARVIVEKERTNVPLPDRLVDWIRYPFQRRAFEALMRERFVGFPWLASAWADYTELQFAREASWLAAKKWPAPGAAAHVRDMGQRAGAAERRARLSEYLLAYYESLFPFLVDFREEAAPDGAARDAAPEARRAAGEGGARTQAPARGEGRRAAVASETGLVGPVSAVSQF